MLVGFQGLHGVGGLRWVGALAFGRNLHAGLEDLHGAGSGVRAGVVVLVGASWAGVMAGSTLWLVAVGWGGICVGHAFSGFAMGGVVCVMCSGMVGSQVVSVWRGCRVTDVPIVGELELGFVHGA